MDSDAISHLLRKTNIISILLALYNAGEHGATITQLRNKSSGGSGSISAYVNLLENMGLAYSRRVPTNKPLDARVIYLSAKGKKFVKYYKEFLEKCKEL